MYWHINCLEVLKLKMKRNIIIAALSVAVAGVATYFLVRRKSTDNGQDGELEVKKVRHLTNAFSKAKQRAINHS